MDAEQKTNVIEIERSFDVDVETLFKAWTEAEQLKQWWHPMGDTLVDVKNELKEGGAVEYHVGESGLQITGSYTEVVPNEKLVYSWVWNMSDEGSESGYTLHITFSSEGEGSKLKVLQEGFSGPEFLKPHEEGWEKGLNDLSSYLTSGSTEGGSSQDTGASNQDATEQDNVKSDENMTDRSGGYNEAPEQVKVGGG
ncbi:SRPBCC family protein [Dyadobacter psychrophilus]|uniref:Uncharacterized conserved protein YndB, AHSA1/START domain n=1 Tax=Dyadobacter psychrophilus TaxID=651661 RepID=A0A1T5E6Z6_9BACT|nr:SRPBCC domain-containing protein [Dyadobacter psychrophilus]SKB79727.1 Uncharacterized conserved protein YndB, AHSA1/START domain [Dyadobacter psychrophilus]